MKYTGQRVRKLLCYWHFNEFQQYVQFIRKNNEKIAIDKPHCTFITVQASAALVIHLMLIKRYKCRNGFHYKVWIANLKLSDFFR